MAVAGSSTADQQQVIFIRDILPQSMKDSLKEKQYDMDKVINFQIKAVSRSKNLLFEKRRTLILALQEEYTENYYSACGPFDLDFLTLCLEEVEKDESEVRRNVLGEQESVEMFKNAVETNQVGEEYLSTARANRDGLTKKLQNIVELREILFVALEILKRISSANSIVSNEKLENLRTAYIAAKEEHLQELGLLESFTKFKLHPQMHDAVDGETLDLIAQKDFDEADDVIPEEVQDQDSKETEIRKDSRSTSDVSKRLEEPNEPYKVDNLVHFKKTKVDKIDAEFNVMAELASNLLKHEEAIRISLAKFKERFKSTGWKPPTDICICPYVLFLQSNHFSFKIKLSLKGYNFSLNIKKRKKSSKALSEMIDSLDYGDSIPEELLIAQQQFSLLSAAIKHVCSMHGRCTLALQSLMNKKEKLEKVTKENPPASYADSLRVAGHLSYNMEELKRIREKKCELKQLADAVLENVSESIKQLKEFNSLGR